MALVGPGALIRPLGYEFPALRLRVALCRGRVQTVYDFAEKKDGLVYDLTEIDGRRSDREIHVPPPPAFTAGNTIESTKIVLTTSYGTIRPCP
jgi:hypothetical protein